MEGKTIVWIITALALVLIGCILFGVVMLKSQGNFMPLSTTRYETHSYAITDGYSNIQITTNTAKVILAPSEDGTTSVVCYEQANLQHIVSVREDTLSVIVTDTRKWYEHIGIHLGSPIITIYLPADDYGNLTVQGSTGRVDIPADFSFGTVDITVSTGDVTCRASAAESMTIRASTGAIDLADASAATLDLSVSTGRVAVSSVTCTGDVTLRVSTGKVSLTDLRCNNLTSNGSTGGLTLKNVVASDTFSIVRTTGSVALDACDAATLFITTDTGSVRGSLCSGKTFVTKTSTGRVEVPADSVGGRCTVTTSTGDIVLTIE